MGSDVDTARIGERVIIEPCLTEVDGVELSAPWYFGSECDGGFAEYTKVAEKHALAVHTSFTALMLWKEIVYSSPAHQAA